MLRRLPAALLLGTGLLAACSPTFNWREIRADATGLKAMLPCKPDQGARSVPMAGREVQLHALACKAGGANFALLFAELGDPARAGEALGQWKVATLANMHASAAAESAFRPAGGAPLPQSVRVVASGQRPDGSKVQSHAVYFARGPHVFQAVVYADAVQPDMTDPFFAGLKFE